MAAKCARLADLVRFLRGVARFSSTPTDQVIKTAPFVKLPSLTCEAMGSDTTVNRFIPELACATEYGLSVQVGAMGSFALILGIEATQSNSSFTCGILGTTSTVAAS